MLLSPTPKVAEWESASDPTHSSASYMRDKRSQKLEYWDVVTRAVSQDTLLSQI